MTFRSFEGRERCFKEFSVPWYTRVFGAVCSCFVSRKTLDKQVRGRWLQVHSAVAPELLNWHHFSTTSLEAVMRETVFYLFMVLFLALSYYVVKLLQKADFERRELVPDLACRGEVLDSRALIDYATEPIHRNGDYHCFCAAKYEELGPMETKDYNFT